MKTVNRKFGLGSSVLLPVLLLGLQVPLLEAAETDSDKKICKQCIKYMGWRGDLDFGLSWVSDDSLRFGDYRGLEEEGFYLALDGDMHFRNAEGRYFDMYATNLGLDSRHLEMRGGNQGHYELRFAWSEIPKYRGFGTQTPFLGVGSDSLTLPADWVAANSTDDMTALAANLAATPMKTQRKTLDAGGTIKFSRNWSYRIDYQRQKKEGTRFMGAGFVFRNTSILPAPVDFTTDLFDMSLMWAGKRGQVQVGFQSSNFDNGNNSLTWQNPFTASANNQFYRAALEPGNEFYQYNMSAAFVLSPRVRVSGQAAMGRMKQDDPFIPYSINPAFADVPLPRASLDGKIDTSTYNLAGKLSARLNRRLSFTARAKWDERDNKTPVEIYNPILTDLIPIGERYNRPYSYKRQQYSADLRYRINHAVRLGAGGRQKNIDRTLQEIDRSEETTWWGEARFTAFAPVQLRLRLENSDRDISDYAQPDDGGAIDHPLLRKFNQADRAQERLHVDLDLTLSENLGISLAYYYAQADYKESVIGLQESDERNYSLNLNYAMGKKVNLYVFMSFDDINAEIVNAPRTTSAPWNAETRDRIDTIGMGVTSRISDKSSIGFDFVSSSSEGDISVQTTQNEDPFAPLKTDLTNANVHFDYQVNEHWGYKLYAEYERFKSQDWAIDNLGVDGISSVLTMGEQSPRYNVWYIRVQASYRF